MLAQRYARAFATERLFFGEEADLWIEIVNAKPLPLTWLKTEDEFPKGFTVRRVQWGYSSNARRQVLVNLFSLRWYERVRRRYRLVGDRRGAFDIGPVMISSGDLFGFRFRKQEFDYRHTVLVYPKIVPLQNLGLRVARPGGVPVAAPTPQAGAGPAPPTQRPAPAWGRAADPPARGPGAGGPWRGRRRPSHAC